MRRNRFICFLGLWAMAATLAGGALMSYHQPFRLPSRSILSLIKRSDNSQWEAMHVLSGSCGCSQRLMRRLSEHLPADGFEEQILVVDGETPDFPETAALLARLGLKGYRVTHIAEADIPTDVGLHGVPMLIVASPRQKVMYLGGYGTDGDQDRNILRQARAGEMPPALPVIGCVVGTALRRKADPLRLKY